MINPGKYRARAVDVTLGESRAKGTPYCSVVWQLEGHPDKIIWYGYLTEKTEERTIRSLRAAGWVGADIRTVESEDGSSLPVLVELVVEHETYEGDTRARVRWVNEIRPGGRGGSSAGGAEGKPLDKAALAKRLAATAKRVTSAAPPVDDFGYDAGASDDVPNF